MKTIITKIDKAFPTLALLTCTFFLGIGVTAMIEYGACFTTIAFIALSAFGICLSAVVRKHLADAYED